MLHDYSWFCRTIHAPVSTPQPPKAHIFLGKIILRHVWLNRSCDGSVGITIRPRNRPSEFGAITGEARVFPPPKRPGRLWNPAIRGVKFTTRLRLQWERVDLHLYATYMLYVVTTDSLTFLDTTLLSVWHATCISQALFRVNRVKNRLMLDTN
jgi:hypothetical protein